MSLPFDIVTMWMRESTEKLNSEYCNLAAIVSPKTYTIIPKNSISDTVQFFADFSISGFLDRLHERNFDPRYIFIKLSFFDPEESWKSNTTEYEVVIYSYLENLIIQNRTPNIMRFIGSVKCPHFFRDYGNHPIPKPGSFGSFFSKQEITQLMLSHESSEEASLYNLPMGIFRRLCPEEADRLTSDYLEKLEVLEEEAGFLNKRFETEKKRWSFFRGVSLEDLHQMILENKQKMNSLVKEYYENVQQAFMDCYNQKKDISARFLFVERGFGKALVDLDVPRLGKEVLEDILFQTFYTLREMRMHGVRHNDLHLGNIWINLLEKNLSSQRSETYIYFIDSDRYFLMKNDHLVKIYDFDLSTFTRSDLQNPETPERCPDFGQCTDSNERYDTIVVLYSLWEKYHLKDSRSESLKYLMNFAYQNMAGKFFIEHDGEEAKQTFSFYGRACKKVGDGCDPDYSITSDEVKTFDEMVDSGSFPGIRSLSRDGFPKSLLPIRQTVSPQEIPEKVFERKFYVSKAAEMSAVDMANRILRERLYS